MTGRNSDKSRGTKGSERGSAKATTRREERLRAALRANLQRRKAQVRARKADRGGGAHSDDTT